MLYKTITGDTQISTQECFLMGVELAHTGNTSLIVYDQESGSKTAAQKVSTLQVTAYKRHSESKFPYPGIKCRGLYADWTAGVGTVYFRY